MESYALEGGVAEIKDEGEGSMLGGGTCSG